MTDTPRMRSIEMLIFENRDDLLAVRMSIGDSKPQCAVLTEFESMQIMLWLQNVSHRVSKQGQLLRKLGLADQPPHPFNVDLLGKL